MKMNLVQHLSLGTAVVGAIAIGNICSAQAFNLYTITDLSPPNSYSSSAKKINDVGQVVGTVIRTDLDFEQGGFFWENGKTTYLGSPYGGRFSTIADINNAGQIIASFYGANTAILWQNGKTTDLGNLGERNTYAYDINEVGQVVGTSSIGFATDGPRGEDGIDYRAFFWEDGKMTNLGSLGGESTALAINNVGQVVGTYYTQNSARAFIWQDGKLNDLGIEVLDFNYVDINDSGQIVASTRTADGKIRPFIWQDGRLNYLGTLGGDFSYPADMNESGQIVGYSQTAEGKTHAVLWQDGKVTDLLPIKGIGGGASHINESGQVLGGYFSAFGSDPSKSGNFLWERDKAVDLRNLIAPNSGWKSLSVIDINDRGQIIGSGLFNGLPRAFLMNPTDTIIDPEPISESIPEPSSIIGSILGLGAVLTTARRRRCDRR